MMDLTPLIPADMLAILPSYAITLTILFALLLDLVFGEAKKYHYLVGFGRLSQAVESRLNPEHNINSPDVIPQKKPFKSTVLGALSWALLVLPVPLLYFIFLTDFIWYWQLLLDGIVLYLAMGLNSLHQHAMQVYQPLKANNLTNARHYTGYLVSRETKELTPKDMARATVESMLENGHDAVIASLIYYLIGGAPLVILHRFANTLDAMWGYKNPRFNAFGYTSARLDDLLGFISAKCCTVLYALQGRFLQSLLNAYQQGNGYKSHNGGWVMAAGATVMNRTLGGSAQYHGIELTSVNLGAGKSVTVDDIPRSILIVKNGTKLLFLLVLLWQILATMI